MVRLVKLPEKDEYEFSSLKELETELRDLSPDKYLKKLDAVDVLSLACQTDPILAETVYEDFFEKYGFYRGYVPIIDSVLGDMIKVPLEDRMGKNRKANNMPMGVYSN